MTKIIRDDGTHFIIPDYREELSSKKISILKNEVSLLSKSYGEFIYIQKNLGESFDVAFNAEPGYLLAESVAKHIKKSNNFIYIERLKNSDTVLLILLKQGKVQINTQISVDTIPDEFIVIQAEQTKFDIYTYGDLPVTATEQESDKFFIGNLANSYTILETSVFENLPRYSECELKPINEAFLSADLVIPTNKKMIIAAIVVVLIILIWIFWPSAQEPKIVTSTETITVKSEYYDYVQTLRTATPTSQINGLIKFLEKIQDLPAGWLPVSINANQNNINISLKNLGATPNHGILHSWAANKGIDMIISNQSINLNFMTAYPIKTDIDNIYQTQEILRVLIDRISPILNNSSLNVAREVSKNHYKELPITISFTAISYDTLNIIAEQFSDLPLLFVSIAITQNNSGLLTGSINIKIVGD